MKTLVLFDGVCGLCNRLIDFLLRRDRENNLLFAPLQGETAAAIIARRKRQSAGSGDTIIVIRGFGTDDETALTRSAAILAIGAALGGVWRGLSGAARLVPRPLADGLYNLVARSRYRFFGRRETCRLPTPAERERFLP